MLSGCYEQFNGFAVKDGMDSAKLIQLYKDCNVHPSRPCSRAKC
jgi:hypothetical protein